MGPSACLPLQLVVDGFLDVRRYIWVLRSANLHTFSTKSVFDYWAGKLDGIVRVSTSVEPAGNLGGETERLRRLAHGGDTVPSRLLSPALATQHPAHRHVKTRRSAVTKRKGQRSSIEDQPR